MAGLDHVAQAPARVGAIADEIDFLDRRLAAFGDLEHQIDAVVRPVNDLRLDPHIIAAIAAIDFDDALHVRLHDRARQRAARFGLNLLAELLVLDALVALELDAADDGVLDDRDDHTVSLEGRADVGEQAGREQRLDTVVDLERVQPLARADAEIGANRLAFDPAVTLNYDRGRRLRDGGVRRHEGRNTRTDNNPTEDQASQGQPSYPHPKSHARCALPLFPVAPCSTNWRNLCPRDQFLTRFSPPSKPQSLPDRLF